MGMTSSFETSLEFHNLIPGFASLPSRAVVARYYPRRHWHWVGSRRRRGVAGETLRRVNGPEAGLSLSFFCLFWFEFSDHGNSANRSLVS